MSFTGIDQNNDRHETSSEWEQSLLLITSLLGKKWTWMLNQLGDLDPQVFCGRANNQERTKVNFPRLRDEYYKSIFEVKMIKGNLFGREGQKTACYIESTTITLPLFHRCIQVCYCYDVTWRLNVLNIICGMVYRLFCHCCPTKDCINILCKYAKIAIAFPLHLFSGSFHVVW